MSLGVAVSLGFFLACALAADCVAESYPSKPIRLVVPYPAGGALDVRARQYTQKLGSILGQQVVVENRAGASGIIATEFVSRATPDGYTLLVGASSTLAINPALSTALPYDPRRDFTPISLLARAPMVLVASPSLGVSNLAELVTLAKAKPGKLTYSSGGSGTPLHLAGAMLGAVKKLDLVHVAYKGDAPALTDLLAGHVDFSFQLGNVVTPHILAGRLVPLMVTSLRRMPGIPLVPSAGEVGIPEMDLAAWSGIVAPRGLPAPIVLRLNAAIRDAMHSPEIEQGYLDAGGEVTTGSPEEFSRFINSEIKKWSSIARISGARLD